MAAGHGSREAHRDGARSPRAASAELAAVFDAMMEAVVVLDAHGVCVEANRAACQVIGFDPVGLSREEITRGLHYRLPDGSPVPDEELPGVRAMRGERVSAVPLLARTSRGERKLLISAAVFPSENGEGRVVITFNDVTEERRLEDQVRRSETQLRRVLDRITDGFLALDAEGRLTYYNRRAEELLGDGARPGRPVWEQVAEPVATAFEREWRRAMSEQEPMVFEERYGPDAWLEVRGYPSPDGMTVYVTEVTERRLASATRRRQRLLSEALNRINHEIDSKLEFGGIMHAVVRDAAEALGADTAAVAVPEEDGWVIKYVYGLPPELEGKPLSDSDIGQAEIVAGAGRPLVADATHDDFEMPPARPDRPAAAALAVPLTVRGKLVGVVRFVCHAQGCRFDEPAIDFASKLATTVSLGLQNVELLAKQRRISETLQSAALRVPEHVHGIRFGSVYRSATEEARVGGDFFDFFELIPPVVAILVGDVSGKGLEAAALASLAKDAIRAYAIESTSPAQTLSRANALLLASSPADSFATAFFGLLDTRTGELTYCCAGHPPPVLKRAAGPAELLFANAPVLGAFEPAAFSSGVTVIGQGDMLVLYTDGLTEAKCSSGERLGEARLLRFLRQMNEPDVERAPARVLDFVKECTGGALSDDLVILAVVRAEEPHIA